MVPLLCESGDEDTLKPGGRPAYSIETDSADDLGTSTSGGGGTLKAPSIYTTASDSNGTGTVGIGV